MAVEFNDNIEEDENNQGQDGKQLGTESAIIQSGDQTAPAGTQQGKSGSYTNLQSYLDANKDQHQGEQLASNVENQIGTANKAQDSSESGFKSSVDQSSVVPNQDLFNKIQSNPTDVANNKDQAAQFQAILKAHYAGPTEFSGDDADYSNAKSQTDAATAQGKAAQNESGRNALLDTYYSRPTYTQGQKTLDQYLVANDPNANWNKVGQDANQAQDRFNNLQGQLNTYAKNAQSTTNALPGQAQNFIGIDQNGVLTGKGQLGDTSTSITNNANQQIAARNSAEAKLDSDLKNRTLTPSEMSQLGLSPGNTLWNQGTDLNDIKNQYVTNNNDWNLQSLTTPEQAAKYNALTQLAGIQNTFLDPKNPNLGSQASKPGYTVNKDVLSKNISTNQAKMNQDLNNTYFDPYSTNKDPFQPTNKEFNLPRAASNITGLMKTLDPNSQEYKIRAAQLKQVNDKIYSIQNQYGMYDKLK